MENESYRIDDYLTVNIYDAKLGFKLGKQEIILNNPQAPQVVNILQKYITLQKSSNEKKYRDQRKSKM